MIVSPSTIASRIASRARRYVGLGLTVLALSLAGYAAILWTNDAATPVAVAAPSDARAWSLLGRSLRADAQLPLAARVQTVIFAGDHQIQSEAQLVRAPQHLSVTYLSGPMRGQASGFSQRWFWRQNGGQLLPYAETAQLPDEMARARFELMRRNYRARLEAPQTLDGRAVEVVELRPIHPAPGARGPARRIFIDSATGLTLRTEAFNYRLQPVSHSTFSDLQLRPVVTKTTFESPAAIAAAAQSSFWQGEELGRDERAVEAKVGIAPPRSAALPQGFVLDGVGVHRHARDLTGLQVAAFARYTDGVNALTLYAVKSLPATNANQSAPLPLPNAPGAMNASAFVPDVNCNFGPGTVISRAGDGGTLVAVGDLPVAVLKGALEGARFRAVETPTPAATMAATPLATVTAAPAPWGK